MLEINGLDFSFDSRKVFAGLKLSLKPGERVVVVGGSGGGKSTLLKLIADGDHPAIQPKSGSTTTMVMQEGALLDHLNVIDNLKLVARYADKNVDQGNIESALSQLNIDSSLHKAKVNQLSGGQVRRVAIARALLTDPDLMLFDEPDAGLDIANLIKLADTVNSLSTEHGKACLTVSHNPFYIARVAQKVYRLQNGGLELLADWPQQARDVAELKERQDLLQNALAAETGGHSGISRPKKPTEFIAVKWLQGVFNSIIALVHWPRSLRDELHIAAYGIYLSLITGLLFFALVGLMLGSTTIAVVKMLSDNALDGFIGLFIKPEMLVDMMGGRYVLYLAPAIGGMLFAARSGSIMCNWLGEMVRGRQVQALRLLNVDPNQYLAAPSTIAVFVSMVATISWFAYCVWVGGVIATGQLFDLPDPRAAMTVSEFDISRSLFWLKTVVYSALVSLTVVALGLAPKTTAHQVNMHTTKTIIYATLSIAFAELFIILT